VTFRRPVNLFDLFIFLIVCLSYVSIILLVLNRFNPYYTVAAGITATGIFALLFRSKIDPTVSGISAALLVVLVIGVVLRVPPYLYVPGGQDQGVYVNMAETYRQKGSTFLVDSVREKAVASGLGEYYDAENQILVFKQAPKSGEFEGIHLPGIYIKDLGTSQYVYQFYPLHPLWMALAGSFLGEKNSVYALVFFSILSIAAFYLLASIMPGGSNISSVLIGIFLALNPLHAFFSKFPVTEVVALCFSSLGFYYLIKYYSKSNFGKIGAFYLTLSASLFGCMFFTRISGFMYVPFFYLLFIMTLIFEKNAIVRNQLSIFFLSIFCLYALSVAYGLLYSYPYCHDLYKSLFGNFFHNSWQSKLRLVILSAGVILFLVFLFRRKISNLFGRKAFLSTLKKNGSTIFCIVLSAVILLAFYKAYLMGFTDKYAGSGRYDYGGHGFSSVISSNVFVVMTYLSPVGFGLFLYGTFGFFSKRRNIHWFGFILFLAMFWYFFTVMRTLTEYHYYYARYLLSEVIPYSLLAITLFLGYLFHKSRLGKIVSMSLASLIAGFFLFHTCYQFKGKSAEGAYASLKEIKKNVNRNDLLLMCGIGSTLDLVIRTPLSFYFDLNTCNIEKFTDLQTKAGKKFLDKFDDVFFLSKAKPLNRFLAPVKQINYRQGEFVKSKRIPKEYRYNCETLHLFKVAKSDLFANTIYPLEMKKDLINFYPDLWTNGNGKILNVRRQLKKNDRYITINTNGRNPFIHDIEWPKPQLYINGLRQEFYSKSRNSFTFRIGKDIRSIQEIKITSATFVPKEEGISGDSRKLGIDVDSIVISDRRFDNKIFPREMKGDLRNFYDGVWTNGDGIIRNINYELRRADQYVAINAYGWNPFMKKTKNNLELHINGVKQAFYAKHKNSYIFRITGNLRVIREMRITSATFVPKEVGINDDPRKLGIDIDSIEITQDPGGP
jgi:hypothetical protein